MRKKIDLLVLLLVLIAGLIAVKNAVAIGDWWHAQRYTPSTEVIELATQAGMSVEGRKLFYRFSPQITDELTITAECGQEKLGCAVGTVIYILAANNEAEQRRNVVTAAHEMLHVAYSRLSNSERDALSSRYSFALGQPGAVTVRKALEGYPAEDYDTEAHSFIGSELYLAGEELEAHYSRYFDERSKSIQAAHYSPRQ